MLNEIAAAERTEMASTFEKLNLKDQKQIVVLNAPETFEPELKSLRGVRILRDVESANEIEFSLAFVTKQKDVDALAKAIAKKAKGDATVWFAYPKGTSKKYKSEINRDNGWQVLGDLGFECVRAVAIDEDWSGLRLRRVEFIKAMKRDKKHAMTSQGKARLAKQ
jgi:aminopeptidase C